LELSELSAYRITPLLSTINADRFATPPKIKLRCAYPGKCHWEKQKQGVCLAEILAQPYQFDPIRALSS
jgi:hypothetical protein